MGLSRLCWDTWVKVERVFKSRASCLLCRKQKQQKKGQNAASNRAKIRGLTHVWNRQQSEPLPCSTPSSVNDSYSACAVVYSFPAVKGCPLKVPFVHRLHFVIQIALFFEMAWGSRLPLSAAGREEKGCHPLSAQGQLFSLAGNESPPLYLPYILSSFSKAVYIYIYIVQKETGVN